MPQRAAISRRRLLAGGLALGCSAAASPLLTPITLAAAPGEQRLVVIILRGAMDGLDVLRPLGDRAYAALRPTLAAEPGHALGDGFFALHPGLGGLMPLWQAGELAFVPAVSTPYRDRRSHFDGQDLLEAGTGADLAPAARRDGWLNRALQAMPGSAARTAFAVGRDETLILDGAAPVARWAPDTRLRLTPQARLLLERVYAGDALFAAAAGTAVALAAEDGAQDDGPGGGQGAGGDADDPVAAYVAARLREETRIAAFSLGGWDTHRGQRTAIRPALGRLEAALRTLRARLGPDWERTAVLAMTEFGRTARENGSGGTDHGTGGALILAGGAVRGGVRGDWPGLGDGALYAGRDLMPVRDVRALAAWALHALFALPRGTLEGAVFPALDMGGDPGILL